MEEPANERRAIPVLARSLDEVYMWDESTRLELISVLSQIPSDEAMMCLLERIDLGCDVATGFAEAAANDPDRAARVLTAGADLPAAAILIARLGERHPQSVALPRSLTEAPDALVPPLLDRPPWTRPRTDKIELRSPDGSPRIEWLENEREQWAHWGPYAEDSRYSDPSTVDFYLFGPTELVRPHLANWAAETGWFYLRSPRLLVSRFELDAYRPALRLARAKPLVGARLLLPFISSEVADVMAGWLVGSRQFAPLAREWFERHGAAAAALLLPAAADGSTPKARIAAQALALIDADSVRAAGRDLEASEAAELLLERDPIDLAPGRDVKPPTWLKLDHLPKVRLRTEDYTLGRKHVTSLVQLLMQSRVDVKHPALDAVTLELQPQDASEFAWALYGAWLLEGRPSKDAWAFDALGALGNDLVANRLAPRVRVWPSFGGAQRAKRGVEILAAIDSDLSLQHLSSIARSAKSVPLRKHASTVLDRVAADRGLLPEQLDDLVAPDASLDQTLAYRGDVYRIALDASFGLVLASAEGGSPNLPAAVTDEEEEIVAAWKRLKREAKKAVEDQRRRMELAMIVQRSWRLQEFSSVIVDHPLLGKLARGLIWTVGEHTAVIDELADLVDVDGSVVTEPGWIRIAHPASSDLEPWRARMSERQHVAPFLQVDRPVHDGDPSEFWNAVVSAASLHALVRRGWQWEKTGHAAMRNGVVRALNSHTSVVLTFEPGLNASWDPRHEPDQRVEDLALHSSEHAELSLFADLPRATRSELLYDLSYLERRSDD